MENSAEIFKFTRLTILWLCVIFGAVWGVCWLVGVAIPNFLLPALASGDVLQALTETLRAIVPLVAVLVFIPINAMFMVLFERRGLALFTVRRGPCRVGPDGLLQTAADAVKLLFKEDITPRGADAAMFTLAPIIFFAPSVFAALPLLAAVTNNNSFFSVVNIPTGVFYILAASSIPVVGIVMGGWASNNKYSLVGGLRSAAQAISYEIPLVLSLVTICLLAGTLDVVKIAEAQAGGFLNWNILGGGALRGVDAWIGAQVGAVTAADAGQILQTAYPDGVLSYIAVVVLIISTILICGLYLTGACAEINRIPFDLPEAESELVSGYNTEYSGIKFAIFFLAEFTNLFIVSSIAAVMFFGGGDNPIPAWLLTPWWPPIGQGLAAAFDPLINGLHLVNPATFQAAIWVILKTYILVFIAVLVRGTLPRFRIDQLMDFGWKRLIPLSLILFMVVVVARELVKVNV